MVLQMLNGLVVLMIVSLQVDILSFFFVNTPVSWKSDKCMIARSSTEVDYKVLANGTTEVIRLQYLLLDLHITHTFVPVLWCDNMGATY